MPLRIALALGVILMLANASNAAGEPPVTEYLSDTLPRLSLVQQGWGVLGIDTAAHAPDREPRPLQIQDRHFTKGLGSHAPGQIVVELDGEYESFEAEIGVQWQDGDVGSVVFQVYVDGEKRFDSGIMRERDAARSICVAVGGAQELALVVTDAGDGITCDVANWGNACVIPAAEAERRSAPEPVDIAPFGRIMTWDPKRTDGCRSSRVEEFRAEDVFLGTEVAPSSDGAYVVPTDKSGIACVGLEWWERRSLREIGLQFIEAAAVPSASGVRVERWVGESAWQGRWETINGRIEVDDDCWRLRPGWRDNPQVRLGTLKIRWIFPATDNPIVLRGLWAFTGTAWDTAKLLVQLERPLPEQSGEAEIYNGAILAPASSGSPIVRAWDLARPLELTVRYARPSFRRSDRTVIRLRLPTGAFAVAVDDVLSNPVYVRDFGVVVTRAGSELTPAELRRGIAGRQTVLERVRRMPDQDFPQAMAAVHNPAQDNGPMMLSLACANEKFVVDRNGAIRYDALEVVPQFGAPGSQEFTRHLDGGWLPVPVNATERNGIAYSQRTYVAPYVRDSRTGGDAPDASHSICVAEVSIENRHSEPKDARLGFTFVTHGEDAQSVRLETIGRRVVATAGGRVFAVVDLRRAEPLRPVAEGNALSLSGALSAGARVHCVLYVPSWEVTPEQSDQLNSAGDFHAACVAYWNRIMSPAMRVTIPDRLLGNVIRASQVYCLMAARNEDDGKRIAPWISSPVYGPLESEANSVILGMDVMGHHDFARRSLDYFIARYSPLGFLTTGYTLVGTGWHLWTLGEHHALTRDSEWLRNVAPEVARVCRWVSAQRDKTKRLDPDGDKMPEYGLVPPGVVADWNVFAYRFFMEAHYCAGLREAARALADVGQPGAQAWVDEAAAFREDILRAYRYTQARSPVVPLRDGTWVPATPGMLYCFGPIADFYPGEDWGRSWAGDVETGSQHLVALGALEPDAPEVEWMIDYFEDFWFLHAGMGDYPAEESEKDWFNLGGFSKMQPYYTRITDVYALRDDVKPFIRSYFNAVPSLLNTENLSFWEHFHNLGAWNKTHET
ncbi:MAG: NPCBM/NEW2 domain-containing protein, partial [Armatimonadota bacterium]